MTIHESRLPTREHLHPLPDYPQGACEEQWEYLQVYVERQRGDWYEYWGNGRKIEGLDNKPVYAVLNYLGRQGWELVSITFNGDFYFKRRSE